MNMTSEIQTRTQADAQINSVDEAQTETHTKTPTESINKQQTVDTKSKVKNDGEPRLPHERDETPDAQTIEPRQIIKQAYSDLKSGLVDTDCTEKIHLIKQTSKNIIVE